MSMERNLGEQPLAALVQQLELSPTHLVRASTEQLNHKMVGRALKGRRLTGKAMRKVRQALQAASGQSFSMEQLFNYRPELPATGSRPLDPQGPQGGSGETS